MSNKDKYFISIQLDVTDTAKVTELVNELNRIQGGAGKGIKQLNNMNKSLKQTQIQARTSGRALQNASYQIQDMIVQISGGVDPMRSFSQQLPQLFINAGKVGAALGLLAAALPLVITYFREGSGAAKSFADSLEDVDSSVSKIGSLDKTLDLDNWKKSWNESTTAVRESMLALLRFQVSAAEANVQMAETALSMEAIESSAVGWTARFSVLADLMPNIIPDSVRILWNGFAADISAAGDAIDEYVVASGGLEAQQKRQADLLGLNIEQYQFLQAILQKGNQITKAEIELLTAWASVAGVGNAALKERIEQLRKLQAARDSLAAGQDVVSQAEGGGNFVTEKDRADAAKAQADEYERLARTYAKMYPEATKYFETLKGINAALEAGFIDQQFANDKINEATVAYKGLTEEQQNFIDSIEPINTENNKISESFSAADAAIKIFDSSFGTALDGVMMGTQSMEDAFENMAKGIIAQLLKLAAYQAIIGAFGGAQGGGFGQTFAGAVGMNAKGNAFSKGNVVPFANGGIVNSPTLFPMKNGAGLMGEAGPEAIMPLSRGSNGKLGVQAAPVNVTVNNMASGVSVKTRETENGLTLDVVMEQVSAAIQKGGNSVANAIENTYSVGRGRAVY